MNKQEALDEYEEYYASNFPPWYVDTRCEDDIVWSKYTCTKYGIDASFFDYVETLPKYVQEIMGYL